MAGDLISLRALHAAILADLRYHYLDRVQTIAAYDPYPAHDDQDPKPLVTPALLLEIESIDPGEDDGTERQPLRLTFVAHCVLSFRTADQQLELREMAADVMAHCRYNRWGYPGAVRQPEAITAQPGEFQPGLAGFDSWMVRWEQVVHVGPDTWAGSGILPSEVWFSWVPAIGTAHVDDYQPLETADP